MSETNIRDNVHGVLWNAWTELGVRGVERRFQHNAIDPEPLIVFTPALSADEPRLNEQVTAWCERFGGAVTTTRLWGIAKTAPTPIREAFETFINSLGGAAHHWQRSGTSSSRGPIDHTSSLPLERPSLARLRIRALAGTGARADVISEILGTQNAWVTATELERLGYTRRSISRVLDELSAARIVVERSTKGPRAFRLSKQDALTDIVAARDLVWPDWPTALTLAWQLLELERSAIKGDATAVSRHEAREDLRKLIVTLKVDGDETPGDSELSSLLQWGVAALDASVG